MSSSIRGVAVCSVVCLSLLAGCGGGVNESPSTESPSSSNPDNTSTAPNPPETSSSFAQQCAADNMLADAPLRSGWAVGQEKLKGSTGVLDIDVGKGKLFVMGPEVTQRAQSYGTFKFLFNGLLYGPAVAKK